MLCTYEGVFVGRKQRRGQIALTEIVSLARLQEVLRFICHLEHVHTSLVAHIHTCPANCLCSPMPATAAYRVHTSIALVVIASWLPLMWTARPHLIKRPELGMHNRNLHTGMHAFPSLNHVPPRVRRRHVAGLQTEFFLSETGIVYARIRFMRCLSSAERGSSGDVSSSSGGSGLSLSEELLLECERTDNTEPIERLLKADLLSTETAPFLRPGSWEAAEAGMRLLARGDAMSWLLAARYLQRGLLCGQRPSDKTLASVFGSPAARWNASA